MSSLGQLSPGSGILENSRAQKYEKNNRIISVNVKGGRWTKYIQQTINILVQQNQHISSATLILKGSVAEREIPTKFD